MVIQRASLKIESSAEFLFPCTAISDTNVPENNRRQFTPLSEMSEEFKAWAISKGLLVPPDGTGLAIVSDATYIAWEAWQEAAKPSQDALRWRAFLNAARIRLFGWAGMDSDGLKPVDLTNVYGTMEGNYAHFGAEFWTIHDAPDTKRELTTNILTSFADACIAEEKVRSAQ